MNLFKPFAIKKPVIGMIHLQALPGTPNNKHSVNEIFQIAIQEALQYKEEGIDALLIENMHDVPYLNRSVGPEIVATMAIAARKIKSATNIPIGVQVLAGANKEALAIANAAGLDFIRAEGYVFSHIADEGFMDADAGSLLRYKKQIDVNDILIFTDIQKKHASHMLTSDLNLSEIAKTAEYFKSDGVIVTGKFTGNKINVEDISNLKDEVNIPIIAGSGITIYNIEQYFPLCDAFIVGSHFKIDGIWHNPIDRKSISKFMRKMETLRRS